MSPVVGMILVLGISIVGIAGILYWGLPAIDEMKANVEHRSVEGQFLELDATVKELVAGTTEKTAKRWQPTLNRGSIIIQNETEGWVYGVIPFHATKDHSFVYSGFTDGDDAFSIYSKNESLADTQVQAWRVNTTTSSEALLVSRTSLGLTQHADFAWAAGSAEAFYLRDASGNDVNIGNTTIHFKIYDDSTLVGEAWFIPTGKVDYRLDAGVGTKTVSQNNGAVITGNGASYTLLNAPPMPAAANTSGVTRHFARAVVLNGSTSFAGDDRFNVLVTLASTFTLGNYDCADTSTLHSDCVEAVQVFAYGNYQAAWYNYLGNAGRGYTFFPYTANSINYLDDREGWMGYTLLQSTVQLTGN